MNKEKIIILGSAYPFRGGGITTFNERLALQFLNEGFDISIYNFSLQYPNFLFPGKSQYSPDSPPKYISIVQKINSVNPFNWIKIGIELKKLKPKIIVVRYWLPFMGPCFGTILRIVKLNKTTKVICIADNIIPHEKRFGDKMFTQYFVKPVDAFIAMSEKVFKDLKKFTSKPHVLSIHPLYDNFGKAINKQQAKQFLGINEHTPIILFFGFIRKYKGLDLLLEAMYQLKTKSKKLKVAERENNNEIKLLIAGEFYDDKKIYDDLIDKLGIRDRLILKTDFIPDSEVNYYMCAADFVIQPYKAATQSGVTPLAYYYEKPMLVTNVGSLPDLVPDKKVGLVAEPNAESIAQKIRELYTFGEEYFIPFIKEEKKKYGWDVLTKLIVELAAK